MALCGEVGETRLRSLPWVHIQPSLVFVTADSTSTSDVDAVCSWQLQPIYHTTRLRATYRMSFIVSEIELTWPAPVVSFAATKFPLLNFHAEINMVLTLAAPHRPLSINIVECLVQDSEVGSLCTMM